MALKNVQRVTFSLPKKVVLKLAMNIPKSKRSKFVADLIEKNMPQVETVSLEEIQEFWKNLGSRVPDKTKKTALQLQREGRLNH